MASYLDNPNINFNPYIQQLPVEEMRIVGMQKQVQYDEGLQRIQSTIDNVAGLDIANDAQKQYLNSKLSKLGNDLKPLAAGDFSKFQLVNSVNGMTNSLIKDDVIKNAVSSTAWYKKQKAEMEKAISEGKSSQSNIYDFNDNASKYLNATDVSTSFTSRYTPYTDVKKKALDAIKSLIPNSSSYDIPFEIVNGRINTNKIANALQRHNIKGVDEKQIIQAISATLTPDDINQLGIDAKYQFRGATPEQLKNNAILNYKNRKEEAVETLEFLKQQKAITTDPNKGSELDERIEQYERLLGLDGGTGSLDEDLKDRLERVENDPDGVKFSIYKDGFIKEFSNAFSWKQQEMQYVTNPLKQQENWINEMRFKQQQESNRQNEFKLNYSLKQKELTLKAEEVALKDAEVNGIEGGVWTPLGNDTDNKLKSEEYFREHVLSVDDAINSDINVLKTRYTPMQIENMIKDWKDNQGVISKMKNVKTDAVEKIKNIVKNQNYKNSLKEKESELRKQAYSKLSNKDKMLVDNLNNAQPLNLISTNKKQRNLSPKDILIDIQNKKAKLWKDGDGDIILKYQDGFEVQVPFMSFFGDSEINKRLRDPLKQLLKIQSDKSLNPILKSEEIFRESLSTLTKQFVPQIIALPTTKDGSIPPGVVGKLSALLTATNVKSIAANEDFDFTSASEMLQDKNQKDTRVFIYQKGDNYQVHLKNEKDPSKRQVLTLDKNDIIKYFGPQYVNNKTQESLRLGMGKGNTNLNNTPEYSLLQKQFGDFPLINKLQITADLNQDLSDPDLYIVNINLKKKNGKYQNFELKGRDGYGRVGYDEGILKLNKLTDKVLIDVLKQENPTFDFSQIDY